MEQKRVSAQPTRSLSFHLPLSVTGISSFEALLELLGIPSLELLYLSWKDQLFPGFTSFDEAQNTITPLWIINQAPAYYFIFIDTPKKLKKCPTLFWRYILSNLKKKAGYFFKFCGLVKISEIYDYFWSIVFWKIVETGEPNSTQPSWWLKASNSGLMAQKA